MGFMVVPLTARGVMVDGMRLSGCSWSCCRRAVPATQMSAPESGRASTVAFPLRDDMWTLMVGAGSKVSGGRSLVDAMSGMAEMTHAPGGVTVGEAGGVGGFRGWVGGDGVGLRPLQTLPKWPTFLHRWHVALKVGQRWRPPSWRPEPQPGQDLLGRGLGEVGCLRRVWTFMCSRGVLVISACCFLAAS